MLHRLLEGFQAADKNGDGDRPISTSSSALTPESKSTPVIGMFIDDRVEVELSLLGIGLDSCVLPLRHGEYLLVQSTDFFYPLVDDPYVMVNRISNDSSVIVVCH